ncbi:MAG: cation transporter [Lentisphaeria bacterium]|nr:cation transporter [Lentisphaeria bacterium]
MSVDEQRCEPFTDKRDRIVVRASAIGFVTNALLTVFKAAVGLASNSIAVVLDAVNNLSDALSAIVTIVGTKLSRKLPDRKHPLGYGRIEYLSTMIVAGIVLYAGITSFVESVKKIIHPETPEYGTVSLVIIAVSVVVKIVLGRYVKAQGKRVNSGALVASGTDAMCDAVLSFSILLSAIVFLVFKISLEAYIGAVISCFIVKAGLEIMSETVDKILGQRPDRETTVRIRRLLAGEPGVRGAYDLILHNYGPDKNLGSVHLELPDTMTVEEVDRLTRKLERRIYEETGVILVGVGVYSCSTKGGESARIAEDVRNKVLSHEWALQVHGFHVDVPEKKMRFDVVMSFDIRPKEGVEILRKEIGEAYPGYAVLIIPDVDVSD